MPVIDEAVGVPGVRHLFEDAAHLVRDAAVPTLVPMHYDLMEGNLGDVDELGRLAPSLYPDGRVVVLERMAETPLAALAGR